MAAPVAIPAASALAVASLAVQGFANVETLGGPRPVSLYALTIARSGERKSGSYEPFLAPLREVEREQAKAQREAVTAWQNAQALWKGERDRILAEAKRGKGEKRVAAQADLNALGPEPAAPPSADRTVDEETRELLPRVLPLSPEARALLVPFSDAIERAQAPGGDLSEVTGYASKAAEQAARIAGVLALWRDLGAPAVTARDMADGIALAQFYLSEASRLADEATVSKEIAQAEALRKWLMASWPHPEVVSRDVLHRGPKRTRESPQAQAALRILEQHGWIIPLDPGTVVRGSARKKAWRIVKDSRDVV